MPRVTIELTNRCNLACQHCFTGRHGGRDDLPLSILQKVLLEAKDNGFDTISFTGGEPTIHRHFQDVLGLTCEAGYRYGFVSNGQNFATIYPTILAYREALQVITFSLDGATAATHDHLRGKGSFRRVMQAVSICVVNEIPFTLNMVMTAHNLHELEAMVQLATRLGSQGVRFCHLMHNATTTRQGFDLSPHERKQVEAEIRHLRGTYTLPIGMAAGHHTTDLFPCAPLQLREVNIDCHGNFTKCCHLSSHGGDVGQGDVIGNLQEMSFTTAYQRLAQENAQFHQSKARHLAEGALMDTDYFPCWYCSLHYQKLAWLQRFPDHPWREPLEKSRVRTERSPLLLHESLSSDMS